MGFVSKSAVVTIRDSIDSISPCLLGFQASTLTLPSIGKVTRDGSCKKMSCTQGALGSSGDVKMTVFSHYLTLAIHNVSLPLGLTSQEHGIRHLYCKNSQHSHSDYPPFPVTPGGSENIELESSIKSHCKVYYLFCGKVHLLMSPNPLISEKLSF